MKIEVGKRYIDGQGSIIHIVEKGDFDIFIDSEVTTYYENGRFYSDIEYKYDLICEVVPNILQKYESGDITKKQFIKEHIRYWSNK